MHYIIDTLFLEKSKYLWGKKALEEMFKELREFCQQESSESKERCFVTYLLEMEQAHRLFLRKIKDMPMIMNCRTKGYNNSRFGGQECAEFMRAVRDISSKYLNESEYLDPRIENSIGYFVTKIRDKAKANEKDAWEFEKTTRQEYLTRGKDNTLEIFKKSGYDLGN